MKDEFVELLSNLIKFQTVKSNVKAKQDIIKFVDNWFKENNIKTKIFEHKETPSIIAEVKGNIDKTILFCAHLDVVPADEKMFELKQDKNILYARGVSDDKGQACLCMFLLRELSKLEDKPTIKVALTTDEEIGGFNGIGRLVEQGELQADAVIVFDYGCEENQIAIKEKGGVTIKLTAKGKSAHASRPWQGQNAIDKLIDNYLRIRQEFDFSENSPDFWCTTYNIGLINGGVVSNMVADKAEAVVDFRFAEENGAEKVLQKLDEILDKDIERQVIFDIPYFESSQDNDLLRLYIEKVGESLGKDIELEKMYGATDARFFAGTGSAVWLAGPNNGGHHQNSEWLDLDSVERFFNAIVYFVKAIQ